MSSASIRLKIKSGLAKAVAATGSANSELVYLIRETSTGGDPTTPSASSETSTLLLNAIFTEYDLNLIGSVIQSGDRRLITDNDVEIKTGDTIRQGSTDYLVMGLGKVAPTSDVLLYFPQVRVQ